MSSIVQSCPAKATLDVGQFWGHQTFPDNEKLVNSSCCARTIVPPATIYSGLDRNLIGIRCSGSSWASYSSRGVGALTRKRSEEHTSELQSPCNLVCRL